MQQHTGKPAIGQINFTAICLHAPTGKWEFNINWVESNKGLDGLKDAAPDYTGKAFYRAKVSHDPKHKVKFEKKNETVALKHEASYAALVSWHGGEEQPFILSVCPLNEFEAARDKKPSKPGPIASVPQGTFRVTVLGNQVSGDLQKIMNELTLEWKEDPTEALKSADAVWEQKNGMKYFAMACPPNLPPVNGLTLSIAKNSESSGALEELKKTA